MKWVFTMYADLLYAIIGYRAYLFLTPLGRFFKISLRSSLNLSDSGSLRWSLLLSRGDKEGEITH